MTTETSPPSPLPSAGLLRRFAAMVYDALLLLAVIMVYGTLVMMINLALGRPLAEDGQVYEGYWGLLVLAGLAASIAGFFCLFWRLSGQTLGMRSWRLRLVNAQGQNPNLRQCALRCLLASLSLTAGGLGYFWRWFDPQGLTFHDRFSQTRVLVLPKAPKAR